MSTLISGSAQVVECLRRARRGQPVHEHADAFANYLQSSSCCPQPVIEIDAKPIVLDLSTDSRSLVAGIDEIGLETLTGVVEAAMADAGTAFAFGRYAEPRALYGNEHFAGATDGSTESRTIHMGVDIFCAGNTLVRAPLDGVVRLVTNNARELDYGPMIVLRHSVGADFYFHTLYGHLSAESMERVRVGEQVAAGQPIATVGLPPVNGNWPPHLHFQLILDLLDLGADFPGVARASERNMWLALSPSPAPFFREVASAALNYSPA